MEACSAGPAVPLHFLYVRHYQAWHFGFFPCSELPLTSGGDDGRGGHIQLPAFRQYEIPVATLIERDDEEAILTILMAIAHHEFFDAIPA